MLNFSERSYWFFRNLAALVLSIPIIPIHILYNLFHAIRIVIKSDGSEVLSFPWER